MSSLHLEPDRALPFPVEQRSIAREIYDETKDLPLVCMHGHVEPEVFADDIPFANPAELLIVPDHYVFRMLASQGIEPARLGVPRVDGGPVETELGRSGARSARTGGSSAARPRATGWNTRPSRNSGSIWSRAPKRPTPSMTRSPLRGRPWVRSAGAARPLQYRSQSTTDSATSDLRHHAKLAADGSGNAFFRPSGQTPCLTLIDRPGAPTSLSWRTSQG